MSLDFQPGQCYQAAWFGMLTEGLTYVEGVLVADLPAGRIALAHAWNEDEAGAVVDKTLLQALREEAELTYIPVRRGTDLTFVEINERGNPADLVALAEECRNEDDPS